jgi:hypothetical protein
MSILSKTSGKTLPFARGDKKQEEGPMIYSMRLVATFLTAFLFFSGVADAQMIFLGRKALGKVRQFTGEMRGSQQPGYDVATVLLEARADKVYSTAVSMLQAHKDWTVTQKDDKSRSLEFTDGTRAAGMQVSSLDENLSQLVIVSTGTSGKSDTTSLVVNGVLRVCKELGAQCRLADD